MNVRLYRKAVTKWGLDAQLDMLQEECAELIMARSKYRRGRLGAKANIAEEMADVIIMINQCIMALKIGPRVKQYTIMKLKRLERRLRK